MKHFNFGEYNRDELEYTQSILLKLLDTWAQAEIALCDAHINHGTEELLHSWSDAYHALQEIEEAIKARG